MEGFSLKAKLKKSRLIVYIYELVIDSIHRCVSTIKSIKRKLVKTRFSYGKCNSDKVFYVIKSDVEAMHLFSLVLVNVLSYLRVSERKGYIPIVDYKNTTYLGGIQDKENYGKINPWEDYFEQPGGCYTLDEVYQSAKVEICNPNKYGYKVIPWNSMMPMPMEELEYWNRIVNKYIRPTKEILEKIVYEKNKLFVRGEKIMGVSIRAGYRRNALLKLDIIKDHPKVESCEYYIEMIQKKMKEWGYEKFFIACDDREYITKIDKHFGEKCYYMDRRHPHMFINDIPVPLDDIKELNREYEGCTMKERTIEYIVETYLLADCDSLYSTIGGGSQFAYIVNGGKYKNLEIYNEGLY